LRYWARLPFRTGQQLDMTVNWLSSKMGTVTFNGPPSLAGLGGVIKTSGKGVWSIKSDKPAKAKMKIAPDGSGLIDLGYGKIQFPPGSIYIDTK
jgi:hypothetical protein